MLVELEVVVIPLNTRLLASALMLILAHRAPAQTAPALQIQKIASYGWSDLSDSTRPLTVTERKLGAGMLGSASGAVEGPDGLVYVLDLPNH